MNFSKKKKKIIDPLELEKEVLFSLRPITSAVS